MFTIRENSTFGFYYFSGGLPDDKQAFGAQAILDVYFERWEIENSYGEIKHQILEDSILLRSQTVDGVNQELWGILLAYNLIRVEMSRIAKEAKVSPLRISFVMALRDIQDEILWCAIASPGSIPKKLRAMRERVKRCIRACNGFCVTARF